MWLSVRSACSPAVPVSTSESSSLSELASRSFTARGQPSPSRFWRREFGRLNWARRLSALMSASCAATDTEDSVISCWAGRPVLTSATPDAVTASTANSPASGPSSRGSLAWFDRDSSSWKTSQRCLFEGWIDYSATLPLSGSMRSGSLFPPKPSEQRMVDRVSGSSLGGRKLWPTPTSVDFKASGAASYDTPTSHPGITLTDAACRGFRGPVPIRGGIGSKGIPVLNPRFVEALLGLPAGHSNPEGRIDFSLWGTQWRRFKLQLLCGCCGR